MRVNHNITAVRTNLNLNRTNNRLDNTTYRLSSGYKINHAKDDPAGYAILKRMNQQIRGLDQANNNSADGISIINTAEGTMEEVHSMLQRMNELAVQATNGVNSPSDREAIQQEITQLSQEINRITESTDYNGRTLWNGDSQRTSYVEDADGKIASYTTVLSQSVTVLPGEYQVMITKEPAKAQITGITLQPGTFSINGEEVTLTAASIADESAYKEIQTLCDRCSVDLKIEGTSLTFTTKAYGKDSSLAIKVAGANEQIAYGEDVEAIPIVTATGFTDTAVASFQGNVITVTDQNGFVFKVARETAENNAQQAENPVTAKVLDSSSIQVQIGSEEDNMMELIFEKVSTKTLGIDQLNLRTESGASKAITLINAAIDKISAIRSNLGAYENRLNYAINNLETQNYNMQDATSRMGDTDMAEEMTSYTELNVLEQATSTILSKANQRAETILQLLQS